MPEKTNTQINALKGVQGYTMKFYHLPFAYIFDIVICLRFVDILAVSGVNTLTGILLLGREYMSLCALGN